LSRTTARHVNTLPENLLFANINGDGKDELVANSLDEGALYWRQDIEGKKFEDKTLYFVYWQTTMVTETWTKPYLTFVESWLVRLC